MGIAGQPPLVQAPGLTTTRAPFIEQARARGELYIEQPYNLYSEENHEAWRRLYSRMLPRWDRYSNPQFLQGIQNLALPPDRVPKLSEVNAALEALTGFHARAVSGYVPAFLFFDCLRRREFPTTVTIRASDKLDYLPEPDIFHDIAGHVPMHTDPAFANTLVRFGECAHTAVDLARGIRNPEKKTETLASIIKAMARFFWFTIEFGLMRRWESPKGVCAYGSGLLSSFGELEHAIISPAVQRYPLKLEWVVNQQFEIHHYQPLLFVVESFDHLFEETSRLERWMRAGKLNNVAPGEPAVDGEDLQSFLEA
jgi:phenylalanine-4-hydroxylase